MVSMIKSGGRTPSIKMLRKLELAEQSAGINQAPDSTRGIGETLAKSPISPTSGKVTLADLQRLEKLSAELTKGLAELRKKMGSG